MLLIVGSNHLNVSFGMCFCVKIRNLTYKVLHGDPPHVASDNVANTLY